MKPLNILALQLDLVWQDPVANRRQIEEMLEGRSGADLIVLPEMFTTGFTMEPSANAESANGPTVEWMQELASEKHALVAGSIIVKTRGGYHNRMIVASPKRVLAEYAKRHLFRMAGEHEHYKPGKEWVLFEYEGWRICPQVCYDLRFPVWSRNKPYGQDRLAYDLLLYPANWPKARVKHWDILLQARAIENQAFVIGVNRVGKDGNGVEYNGHSAIINPLGEILDFREDTPGILEATLDPGVMHRYRKKFPAWQDADDFDLYP